MPLLDALSAAIGVPEPSLRLLLSIVAGLPAALAYRVLLDAPNDPEVRNRRAWLPAARNAYLVVFGLAVSLFYSGPDIVHSLLCVSGTYLICGVVGGAFGAYRLAVALTWAFNMTYLLAGYYFTATEEYTIDWTMPHCVLCLRLLGFAMDYYDGQQIKGTTPHAHKPGDPDRKNPVELNRRTKYPITFDVDPPLRAPPPFHEFLGYCYFFGAFLVGPQFSFSLYKKFIHGRHLPRGPAFPSGRFWYTLNRIVLGITYIAVSQLGGMFFSTAYLSTKAYAARPFLQKLAIMWITGKLALNKYLGVWILNEGNRPGGRWILNYENYAQ
ncbi:MAG: MBOAT, membrane-bound O-acyltransferase family-domain-containing protein [Olpidium bornovanus]|uniref:Lysophospholipid acyltransferase 5 n=1 Tax=Olpidium bornovanus TaxID=278681 RepID=A0A8H7ZYN2_9FUNG|nr:MAG: MBOAT, membrane-bound O-acyltransferase family-domain-containing protein [Olpidium bornovanus]